MYENEKQINVTKCYKAKNKTIISINYSVLIKTKYKMDIGKNTYYL